MAAAPAGASGTSARHYFYPQAGNGEYLVYSQCNNSPRCSSADASLRVRDDHGHIRVLHRGALREVWQVWLTDNMVVAANQGNPARALWWNLTTHRHGVRTMPTKATVVGALPNGWLYAYPNKNAAARTLFRQGPDGKRSVYAKLPRFRVYNVLSGTQGLVTNYLSDPLHYRRFGSSTTKTLDAPAHKYATHCVAVTHSFAACESDEEDVDGAENISIQMSITPLSGGPTVSRELHYDGGIADAQPNGLVAVMQPPGPDHPSRLVKLYPDGHLRIGLGHHVNSIVVAYGKIIVGHGTFARPRLRHTLTWQTGVRTKQHVLLR